MNIEPKKLDEETLESLMHYNLKKHNTSATPFIMSKKNAEAFNKAFEDEFNVGMEKQIMEGNPTISNGEMIDLIDDLYKPVESEEQVILRKKKAVQQMRLKANAKRNKLKKKRK